MVEQGSMVADLGLQRDERLVMSGRPQGGMDGHWQCPHCGRLECWVTKTRYYRCGKSNFDAPCVQLQSDQNVIPPRIAAKAWQQTEREWA